ncbi:MAG: crotonase/enoyl-CoA hydratase family protein [Gammaproteobacteria bacterium]|jgi:enoyl-CoA hydratase|nr:crotonase/enoyl-CoA hydratase family protein [Gammaproteobacteria bacterium]HJP35655.1 crotonase/enoyl-CoA hydratase family protein [Gammaproteobacteria bacterium]
MSDAIDYERVEETALITIDDGKANAFGYSVIEAFNAALDRAENDARAVAILGRPGLLSGGFDLAVIRGGDESEIMRLVVAGARLLMRLYGHAQPVIVGATGHAVALGALMLLAADHRLGIRGDFKIGLNETAVGLPLPAFAIELATARLSPLALTAATLGANMYDPDAAAKVGYLDEVTEPEALRETALARAEAMAKLDGPAFAASKSALRGEAIRRALDGLD